MSLQGFAFRKLDVGCNAFSGASWAGGATYAHSVCVAGSTNGNSTTTTTVF